MEKFLHTKIIATIGPASSEMKTIEKLIKAGTRIFRINSSHGTPDEHRKKINNIRKVAGKLNLYIPIILDLQGPKIRIGKLKKPVNLQEGQHIILKPSETQEDESFIPVDYCGIEKNLHAKDTVFLDDGKIKLEVLSSEPDRIKARVVCGGILTSRKGLNIPGATTDIPAVTPRDIDYIKFAVENKVDYIALSFVRTKQDIIKAREYLKDVDIPIIAKIEKPEAVDNLSEIISVSDAIMVARGDLGIEISPERVPVVQKRIKKEANTRKKEVITATQMLESMISSPIPTRAEASDVANAIIDGTDAVMLSGETAIGKFPVETVKIMRSIAENVEENNLCNYNVCEYSPQEGDTFCPESQTIVNATIRMLDEVEINAIVAYTRSGFTAGLLSKAKPSVPIIAISDNPDVCVRLNLDWGVLPFYMEFNSNFTEDFLRKTDEFLIKNTFLEKGDKIVITGGMPSLAVGTTNFIRLHKIGVF